VERVAHPVPPPDPPTDACQQATVVVAGPERLAGPRHPLRTTAKRTYLFRSEHRDLHRPTSVTLLETRVTADYNFLDTLSCESNRNCQHLIGLFTRGEEPVLAMPGSLTRIQTCVINLHLLFVRQADERGFHRFLLPLDVEFRINRYRCSLSSSPPLAGLRSVLACPRRFFRQPRYSADRFPESREQ